MPSTPESPGRPLPGLCYSSLRSYLHLAEPSCSSSDSDTDWGQPDPPLPPYQAPISSDKSDFEFQLSQATGPKAVSIASIRKSIVASAKRDLRLLIARNKRGNRVEIERRLGEIAKEQIKAANSMLKEMQ
eukprot:GFKZ01001374.1.p1 GENE.GFKZ01001374.1~~GFKZ01001374.1.p1  ORF type:complete len:130 (+),score=10.28 GFKZ01001374.1:182-571(+)